MYLVVDMNKSQAVVTMAMNVLCLRNVGNLSVSRKNMSFSSITLLYGFICLVS